MSALGESTNISSEASPVLRASASASSIPPRSVVRVLVEMLEPYKGRVYRVTPGIMGERHGKNRQEPFASSGLASSAANVGTDKDSEKRQRHAIQGFAKRAGFGIVDEFYDAAVSGADPIGHARASRRSLTASRATACVPSSSRTPAASRVN